MISTERIFSISSDQEFEQLALEVFKFQFENNQVYRSFCDLLYIHPSDVQNIKDIPFLPIQFFKSHEVLSNTEPIQMTFESSGTTGSITSKHHITDVSVYELSFIEGFKRFYGAIEDYVILGLLPSYLEREGSSLVYMVDQLIKRSKNADSGFYLDDTERLISLLKELDQRKQPTILFGVSFALLDLIEEQQFELEHIIIMETGGMKGRKKEIIRTELHDQLKKGFGVDQIHSEYGMTELLSQAYAKGGNQFKTPPWMKVLIRDPEDALTITEGEKTGAINIIDLANINSCSFIATQDLGKLQKDGFEVLGRFDHSDVRGCNLMVL